MKIYSKAMQGGEDDLDALLKRFQLQDKKAKEIEIQHNADPPSARLFANFTPIPGAVSYSSTLCCCLEWMSDVHSGRVPVHLDYDKFQCAAAGLLT